MEDLLREHGRVAAAEYGFRMAYEEKRSLDYAVSASTEYVMQY